MKKDDKDGVLGLLSIVIIIGAIIGERYTSAPTWIWVATPVALIAALVWLEEALGRREDRKSVAEGQHCKICGNILPESKLNCAWGICKPCRRAGHQPEASPHVRLERPWLASLTTPTVQPTSSASVTPKARLLYQRFLQGGTGEDIAEDANKIGECLDRNDATSEGLLDLLKPKARLPSTGPSGSDLLDLTGGRAETPYWIALQLVINQRNPFYHEYTDWVRHNYQRYDTKWISALVEYLSRTASSEMVRVNCNRILEECRSG
jgi:hypothetical protein